ncbi:MAG: DUF2849 domain-containing protein, partial [Pseudomonadota bacterium]
MAKTFTAAVVTANDLVEGHSVFLGPEGWTRRIDRAMVALTEDQAAEFDALAQRHVVENRVVGPYRVDVTLEAGAPVPVARRAQIRAAGAPTIAV